MARITLGEARKAEHGICTDLGFCPEDDRVRHVINQAQLELINKGRWWGTYQEIQIFVTDGFITWPRDVAHVEEMDVCCEQAKIVNQWYRYLPHGAGRPSSYSCGGLTARDRGTACVFSEIRGVNKTIRTYPTNASDVGKKIRYQGHDHNGIWIRSLIDGVMQDGEQIVLALPYVDTVAKFRTVTGVQKEETVERVLVFEHDTDLDTSRAIAIYEPSETAPVYRRSTLAGASCCCSTINGIVKLEYIPAKLDSDWLLIGNLSALRKMANSITARKNNEDLKAMVLMKEAVKDLNDELRTHTGDLVSVFLSVHGTAPLRNRFAGMN